MDTYLSWLLFSLDEQLHALHVYIRQPYARRYRPGAGVAYKEHKQEPVLWLQFPKGATVLFETVR